MANGILIIDKPEGWTSMDVCAKLRGALHEKRVGHGGTLDPMATGVLPVFFGRATRAVEYATNSEKEYVTALRLGVVTDTQDTTGRVLEERPVGEVGDQVEAVLEKFRGRIEQIPPMYSAIKVQGKKLYELARKGEEVERKPRSVTIFALELLPEAPFGWKTEENTLFLRVRCSKGTYIRSLCHDIGQALGCGGCMAALRRVEAGGVTLAESVPLEAVLGCEHPEELLRPVDGCFAQYPALTIRGRALFKAKNGNVFAADAADGLYRVYDDTGAFLLLGCAERGQMTTVKSFFEV